MSKKRYWLKVKENFYDEDEMVFIRSQKNGFEYLYLWNRLLLKCLRADCESDCGFLRVNNKLPYNSELFSQLFGLNKDVIEKGIELFVNMGMLEILDDGTIYIESVQRMIGKESESAERVRSHREKKALKVLPGNNDVTKCNNNINKEKEKEKEKEKKEFSENVIHFTNYFFNKINDELKPTRWIKKPPDIEKWYIEIDRMNRRDSLDFEKMKTVFDFAMNDKFWCGIFITPEGFRRNFDKIEIKMNTNNKKDEKWFYVGMENGKKKYMCGDEVRYE